MRTAKTLVRLGHSDLSLRLAHIHIVGFVMSWPTSFCDVHKQKCLVQVGTEVS